MLILLNSWDLELNPGPYRGARKVKYPCGICTNNVSWNTSGVRCDQCHVWFHQDCMNMPTCVYEGLTNISWYCSTCGLPNFSTSLFSNWSINTSNSFSSLDIEQDCTSLNQGKVSSPKATSSPIKSAGKNEKNKKRATLRILTANFQGIQSKKQQLLHSVDSLKPDIVVGTESKITSKFKGNYNELFPPGYRVFTNNTGLGMFVLVREQIPAISNSNQGTEIS